MPVKFSAQARQVLIAVAVMMLFFTAVTGPMVGSLIAMLGVMVFSGATNRRVAFERSPRESALTRAARRMPRPSSTRGGPTLRRAHVFKVLVADDNALNRLISRAVLESLGCEVIAIDLLDAATHASQAFDLIIMSQQMRRLDGLEATRRIRQSGPNRQTPIVAMVALTSFVDLEALFGAGANAVLPRPMTRAAIIQTLARCHHPRTTQFGPYGN